jgi:class 3 adenylate cyclase
LTGLLVHAASYVAVTFVLVATWVLTAGSTDELRTVAEHPENSLDRGFWPVWPIIGWGALLAIHAAVTVALVPRRARRTLARRRSPISVPVTPPIVDDATPRRRWVVVMFTDICDSTSENERLGDEAWHQILSQYRTVVRSAVSARNGTEISAAGDGFLLRFESPSDAVLAGVDIQRTLSGARLTDPSAPHTRIGLHAGDVVDDRTDVLGHVVNLASRVSAAASRDEILVTEPLADQLVGSLLLEDRGLQPLKGVSQPRHLLAVRWDDAPPHKPGLEQIKPRVVRGGHLWIIATSPSSHHGTSNH